MQISVKVSALFVAIAAGAGLVVPLAMPASAALAPSVSCSKVTVAAAR